jgi:hypothetical protein
MAKVQIWGPNLPRTRHPETFHVHAAGCADTKRGIYRQVPDGWMIDATSVDEIVQDVYPPSDFDYDPTDIGEYEIYSSDVYVFPCVTFH